MRTIRGMINMSLEYEGSLRCKISHGPSGTVIHTDAPVDNHGKGESFSPSDLVCSALASCMMTIMGIYATRQGAKLEGSRAEIVKEMVTEPVRRIGKITILFHMAAGIDPALRPALERAAHTCPVHKSLNPDILYDIHFQYPG